MAIALATAEVMRELDRETIEDIGIAGPILMEIAGRGCAEGVEELLTGGGPGSVAVMCGKGNNGGDGLVAARHLTHAGHGVDVYLLGEADRLKGDAALNYGILGKLGISVRQVGDEEALAAVSLAEYDVILDAIFGTGLSKPVRGFYAKAIEAINSAGARVVAVDMPSGIDGDTGQVMGVATRADLTVTFGLPKPGQVLYPGAAHAGEVSVVDIGIPPGLTPTGAGFVWLMADEDVQERIGPRAADDHKGRFGHLAVVAGSPDKPGAAGLCCRAAVRSGAGLVTLAAAGRVLERVVVGACEFMGVAVANSAELIDFCSAMQAVALGPGLGTSQEAADFVREAVAGIDLPMVIDADGLNNLAGHLELLSKTGAERVLTPHPGEMARLAECTTADVQRDRLGVARRLAGEANCVVVLKGAATVVAAADKSAWVIPTGNPGMASGGTGDVLTGMLGSFLARGLAAFSAARLAAYLHGEAGDFAARQKGQRALAASDIIESLGSVLRGYEYPASSDEA